MSDERITAAEVIAAAAAMARLPTSAERHAALARLPAHVQPLAKELALSQLRLDAHWRALLARRPDMAALAPDWALAEKFPD